MNDPSPRPPVDELELRRPELPIKVMKRERDVEQVDRWARQVVELIGIWKVGPAGVMQMMETDRSCREIPEEYREPVARRALQLRSSHGKELEKMPGTKRERMTQLVREALKLNPGAGAPDVYELLPSEDRASLKLNSFYTTYFSPTRAAMVRNGEIQEEEEQIPVEEEEASELQKTETPEPEGEEPNEDERSEAAPSPGVEEHLEVQGEIEELPVPPLIEMTRGGRGRFTVVPNGDGYRIQMDLHTADDQLVDELSGIAWESIVGLGSENGRDTTRSTRTGGIPA